MQRRTKGVTLCLEKAYDRLPRGELRKSGGVEKYLRMIQGMYKDSEMCGAGQCEGISSELLSGCNSDDR